jgi:hypothetical protein
LHQIGAGALGPVFRAYEPDQDRLVAVKLFKLDLPPERAHQLVAELEKLIAADLTHPSIAAPIAAGISGTSAYFAQDFVAADSLDLVVRNHGPAPASDALRVATQLGGALDFAAAVDVLHGSLHPRDVLVSSDDTRLIGLGVAQALDRVGVTPPIRRPYTAPERAANGAWDRRADVFTLAALIYEMLAGKRFATTADQAGDTLGHVSGADAAALKRVFAMALADDPAKRFASALEFAEALKGALTIASVAEESPKAQRPKREADVALPFEDPHPTDSFDIAKVFHVKQEPVDLPLHDDAEPVIQLREDIAVEPPLVPLAGTLEAEAPKAEAELKLEEPKREASPAEPAPPRRDARRREPPKVESEVPERRRVAPPTAFVDQGTDEFRQSALEKTRSAIWPLALAVGVGLVVGFAGGYGVAMRDRLLPSMSDTPLASTTQLPAPAVASTPTAAAPVSPPAVSAPASETPATAPKPDPSTGSGSPRAESRGEARSAEPLARPIERAVPAAASGRLVVRSTPAGAKVAVDGKDAGTTPATLRDLSIGPHTVRVTEDGYATGERRIVLSDDRASQAMRFELVKKPVPGVAAAPPAGPGSLMIESRPPGASVYIDGKLVGTTPMQIETVAAGDHAIGLASDGYQRWTGAVRVATGERARITASLER